MEFARKNKDLITKLYTKDGLSSYQIAEKLNTNSTKILRALNFLGIERRDYSEAQAKALEKGRSQHPTKGKKLSKGHKLAIGKKRAEAWTNMSVEEKQRISEINKAKWDAMSDEEKYELRELAMAAVRDASRNGSKTERHIRNGLEAAGYTVTFHKTNLVPGSNLEVDLFLPELKLAIEIDGPAHFIPIWGEEKLRKQQSADTVKQGLLLSAGYAILRVRQLDKSISLTRMNTMLDIIVEEVQKVEDKFPPQGKRLIEIQVENGETKRI